MKREYCCGNCGLVWLDKLEFDKYTICPECKNDGNIYGHNHGIFACNTISWIYAEKAVLHRLKERERKIHYDKNHPEYKK